MTAPSFDLEFRPGSYWDPADPVTAIVANIVGHVRRQCVRDALQGDPEMRAALAGDDEVMRDFLSEERRDGVGRWHPSLMGGEYLPPYLPGEIEIARIALESVTLDVIAVRARRGEGKIHYRVVDEYETEFRCAPDCSDRPLSLGELTGLIDSIGQDEDGVCYLERILESNLFAGGSAERLRGFIEVSSLFYPDLQEHYARWLDQWVARKSAEAS